MGRGAEIAKGEPMNLKIKSVAYHRNGSAGTGFYVVLFSEGRGKTKHAMVGVIFPGYGEVAVFDVGQLAAGNIAFGEGNSWNGPEFEGELRAAVLAFEMSRCASSMSSCERRDFTFGQHLCYPFEPCAICGESRDSPLFYCEADWARGMSRPR